MSADLRQRIARASELNALALRERFSRARQELPPPPGFAESTIPGLLVAELDDLPPEALDLEEVVRQAEGRAS